MGVDIGHCAIQPSVSRFPSIVIHTRTLEICQTCPVLHAVACILVLFLSVSTTCTIHKTGRSMINVEALRAMRVVDGF